MKNKIKDNWGDLEFKILFLLLITYSVFAIINIIIEPDKISNVMEFLEKQVVFIIGIVFGHKSKLRKK